MLDVVAQIGLGILEIGVHFIGDLGAGAPDEDNGSQLPESDTGTSKPVADEARA